MNIPHIKTLAATTVIIITLSGCSLFTKTEPIHSEDANIIESQPQMVISETEVPRIGEALDVGNLTTVSDFFYAIPDKYFLGGDMETYSKEDREQMIEVIDNENWYIKLNPKKWDGGGSMAVFLLSGSDTKYVALETTGCGPICMQSTYILEYKNNQFADVTDAMLPKIDQEQATQALKNPLIENGEVQTAFLYVLPQNGTTIKIIEQYSRFESEDGQADVVAEIYWRKGVLSIEYK